MRRFVYLLGFSTVGLMLVAFRCPGPDPQVGADDPVSLVGGGGSATSGGGEGGDGDPNCQPGPDEDFDGDGYSLNEDDCDDCDDSVHPGAAELPTLSGEPVDENCDGVIDKLPSCEQRVLAGTPFSAAEKAAYAMDLCDVEGQTWGLQDANFRGATGNSNLDASRVALQHATPTQVGAQILPRNNGSHMLALSTGVADLTSSLCNDIVNCGSSGSMKSPPDGFPRTRATCPEPEAIYDDIALEVVVRPPPNAEAFSFHALYLTHEYPIAVCSRSMDHFIVQQSPHPSSWTTGNLLHDDTSDLMPLGADFLGFRHCNKMNLDDWARFCLEDSNQNVTCPPAPLEPAFCPAGSAFLTGTPFFEAGASTGWLETRVPITTDQDITLRFVIFDTDSIGRDSMVLLDGFTWLGASDLGAFPKTFSRD